ncbi:MAG: tetratricopeptide repeat protein, partial [Planctomycetes bacterium]|nr:tetratricopeptide repeat protein [Planctomycetota bacterium]
LQERPDDTAVLLAFGAAAASLDDARTAEQAWQRAFVVDPACDQAACNLGRLYLLAGQREAARRWLTTALRLRPDNQLALSLLQQLR